MENIDIIALLLTIIAIFIAVFVFRRFLVIIAAVIILAVIGYFIIQSNGGGQADIPIRYDKTEKVKYLEQFKDYFCGLLYDQDDSLMCSVIVEPIYKDITSSYSAEELSKMNKKQITTLILQTAAKHKKDIITHLPKDKNYLWEDFILAFKNNAIY